jgi:FkbM family methyltransferase
MIEQFTRYIDRKNEEYIIFDIGSRDCLQSIEFYNTFPRAKIYAFECNPNTLGICRENIKQYSDRITLIEGAVCDYDGEIKFYPIDKEKTQTTWVDGNPGASSLFKSNGTYIYEKYVQYEIKTNCHRLDTIIKEHNIPKVDIIWMDLQGAELLALKGLGTHLRDVKYIHTEVSHKEMYSGQVMFNEINEFMKNNNFIIRNNLSMDGWQEDVIYQNKFHKDLSYNMFDIVIPVGPNDIEVIAKQIECTKKNIIGYRNIYLICSEPLYVDGCYTIYEKIFPFNLDTVAHIHGKSSRNGWYLQQLLKLYAGNVIPNILERYLVIDADTFFLKPTTFIDENKCLYNYGVEYHSPYFEHMARLSSDLIKVHNTMSGICHHMIFETKYINELFKLIEDKHNDTFYNVFLKFVTYTQDSGASEYELYFNFMLLRHNDKIKIRKLDWSNTRELTLNSNQDYISYHHYGRK